MNDWLFTALVVLGSVLSCVLSYWLGIVRGRKQEKARAEHLCHQAILERMSPSVRRVWNSIAFGRTELISEDEFFGPPVKRKPVRERNSDVEDMDHGPYGIWP
jgi:hypothetical protein